MGDTFTFNFAGIDCSKEKINDYDDNQVTSHGDSADIAPTIRSAYSINCVDTMLRKPYRARH